jgi:predicted nuclease of restriction endonuclease-like (RecB) superfamily
MQIDRGKEFYLLSATRGRWSHRELERQIKKSAFERTMLSELKLATALRVLPENATGVFKDSYLLDFLDLPDTLAIAAHLFCFLHLAPAAPPLAFGSEAW